MGSLPVIAENLRCVRLQGDSVNSMRRWLAVNTIGVMLWFLKYISDAFQELHDSLTQDKNSDPEGRDEYLAENVF